MNNENVCLTCGKKFSCQSNVNKHVKLVHKEPHRQIIGYDLNENSTYQCLEGCEISFKYNQDLIYHLKVVHGIDMEFVELIFSTFEEFKTWLETEEIMYGVQYARLTGWKKSFKHEKLYYDCARSGKQQTNKDKPKIRRGRKSFKLNRNCTSKIIITKHLNPDLYHVGYYRTHYGHSLDDTNKRIPKQQREEVVRSLKRGLSPTRILELEAERDSLHRKKLKRRDINNIKRSLKQQIPATEETPRINDVILLVEEVNSANERESLLKEIESTALQIVTSSEGYDNGSLVLLLENLKSVAATVPPIDTDVAGGDMDAAADLKLLGIQ
ncbi:uncharacterized protein LOC130900922 [Diorhabda carinulata]|uniref:uncharacterized protein LOC130900922 n=1 Tax=Diorhabda carinulata TaxID=1163345 RepID=UPI0025A0B1B9|nr:uncharacterized protein LOC130900922 [Diorhabda carinulata]